MTRRRSRRLWLLNCPPCWSGLPMSRQYELLIFDWDGTLMDSIARIVNCFGNACADAGLPVPPESAMRHVIGLGLVEAVDALVPGVDNVLRERVVAQIGRASC